MVGARAFGRLQVPPAFPHEGGFFHKDGLTAGVTGYGADPTAARANLNSLLQSHLYTFGEIPPIYKVAAEMAQFLTQGIYRLSVPLPLPLPLACTSFT